MNLTTKPFGKTSDGKEATLYTLSNDHGMAASITDFGAILVSLLIPDSKGEAVDVTLGFDDVSGYQGEHPYFGATVGRYANRIANGRFTLDGNDYQLATNNGPNHLHGGDKGFDKKYWDVEPVKSENGIGLQMQYLSKDGEENYPGNLTCTVTYMLTQDNELKIRFQAMTDKATPVNLTHHTYFNLAGQGSGTVLDHEVMIDADSVTEINDALIPTGNIENIKATALDFNTPKKIGERIDKVPGGYDHNFILNKNTNALMLAAKVTEPSSGRFMEVYTTEPAMQLYTGNFLDGTLTGKDGKVYEKHYGFCMETQHYPDSPNHENFPNTILKPNEQYLHDVIYRFGCE